eukprot:706715-Pyramimonas_sp.AAC.1
MGGSNMKPDALDYNGVVSALDAVIVAAEEGARRPAGRAIDYDAVGRELAAGARAIALATWPRHRATQAADLEFLE